METDKKAETAKKTDTPQERQASATYTMKSLRGNIQKLENLKMATKEELAELKKHYETIVKRWIGGNLNF